MDVRAFDFDLPPELIAQEPPRERGGSRLLHLDRATGAIQHSSIAALPGLLRAGDLVVGNDTRVFPARLLGRRIPSGGAVECLLVARMPPPDISLDTAERGARHVPGPYLAPSGEVWEALVHPGQKLKPGMRMVFEGRHTIHGEILEQRFFGRRVVRLWTEDGSTIDDAVDAIGHMPLPPYIKRDDVPSDRDRYQTVFAQARGSIAAPTAGLHFTPAILDALRARGAAMTTITLHVGYGTFQPVRAERVEDHHVEAEHYQVSAAAADAISRARADGRRIIAVGTTTTRTLEHIARSADGTIAPGGGVTDLFIYPGFEFQIVDALLTNFHLPKSSLLMLVAAFAGLDLVRSAYDAAIAGGYRFYSYGDAMLIT